MKRDIVCCSRLLIDSLPEVIRNSKILFLIARALFKLPPELFSFREQYSNELVPDLSSFYDPDSTSSLPRISQSTDINSLHMRLIESYFLREKPLTALDAGCGTGFLINYLSGKVCNTYFVGIDYQPPSEYSIDERVDYRSGDLLTQLCKIQDKSIEFVICAHVIEHLSRPEDVVRNLRRIASKCLIIICPLEKEYKWGMNYHINFYPDSEHFISFLRSAFFGDSNQLKQGVIHECIGDIMYVETYS